MARTDAVDNHTLSLVEAPAGASVYDRCKAIYEAL